MSEANSSLEQILSQLKCHFTWNLFKNKVIPEDLEERVNEQIEDLNSEFKGTMYNMLAYIKHLDGQNEAALECLKQAEEFTRQEHADQAEVRNLVTWGNYAWVYYHLGRLPEAQAYIDKVKQVCEKFSNPYSIECPQLESEEGWTRLKCGNKQFIRATVCFKKALEKHPNDPEFTYGLAIATYHMKDRPAPLNDTDLLRKAIELNPDNHYVKLLLALRLQKMGNSEGEKIAEEFLEKGQCVTSMLQQAAKFYQTKGDLDKAIELLERVLEKLPNNTRIHFTIGTCYQQKVRQIWWQNNQMSQEKEKAQYLRRQAMNHFKKADNNRNISKINLNLAFLHAIASELKEAEHYYQREFSKKLPPSCEQKLQVKYGKFLFYNMKNEDGAIHHYMEAVKINYESQERKEAMKLLTKIAQKRVNENRTDSQTLHLSEFLQQQN
ncbi:interferon-induced protein with tetratricopeptide repeats 2-like [Suncus etruscus]|uniref:interferon-induced protein with tetratricopeptide repeats 2-like n=1 Tax=Suncus etruscus TaxID=109475 RepID=UPI00210F6620|nr:interferon-induced protein with tetratricopeptide repeats 2-like [Suncus etruscus]